MPKAQTAIEYLTTYGWAILILGIVVGALYMLGLFSTSNLASNTCIFPADFSCLSATLYTNGNIVINIQQATQSAIDVTAIGCNDAGLTTNMMAYSGASRIFMQVGSNYTWNALPCYASANVFATNTIGTLYKGYIVINYTSLQTGFPHTVIGRLLEKVA